MANRGLFRSGSVIGEVAAPATAINMAGGKAYDLGPKWKLAQYAATGCFNGTYYTGAQTQLDTVLKLCAAVDDEYIAKVAVFSRKQGFMKDMPAMLLAVLAKRNVGLLSKIFNQVINNGRMLRNFVQIIRSGVTGRRSLGTRPKKLVAQWINNRRVDALFRDSVGNDPSIADIIKLARPKPANEERKHFYAYLIGRDYDEDKLPALVRDYERYKRSRQGAVPKVEFRMLTALGLGKSEWQDIASNARWTMTRMNLNTFARHGVFEDKKLVAKIASRLKNPEDIRGARAFPYQLLAAYKHVGTDVPMQVQVALQEALEIATENVPAFKGKVYVCPDVSGSMNMAITGVRKGATSKVRCVDVAALIAATVLRRNPEAEILPFDTTIKQVRLNPLDTVMTNARILASFNGGGTACCLPLLELNRRNATGDLVLYISDNQSWADNRWGMLNRGNATTMMAEWKKFKGRNPKAKLVCIDIAPNGTVQASDDPDILNIGGFSDNVFKLIDVFVKGSKDHWVNEIESVRV